ncbi:helix-turn-helix domain-containing protein [Kocuria aegyptia]|uniref:helix-turn-helix domain-containing protein n=1 Tax=Kocuria aegyptia TaxID=330943 RepID=UPI0031E38C8C
MRNLADPINVDSTKPNDPMAQLAVVLLALFGQTERTYTLERAAHPQLAATVRGRRIGRPTVVDPDTLADAAHVRESGHTIAEIVATTGITRTTLYRHLPPRPPKAVTAEPITAAEPDPGPTDRPRPGDRHVPLNPRTSADVLRRCLGWIDFGDASAVRR